MGRRRRRLSEFIKFEQINPDMKSGFIILCERIRFRQDDDSDPNLSYIFYTKKDAYGTSHDLIDAKTWTTHNRARIAVEKIASRMMRDSYTKTFKYVITDFKSEFLRKRKYGVRKVLWYKWDIMRNLDSYFQQNDSFQEGWHPRDVEYVIYPDKASAQEFYYQEIEKIFTDDIAEKRGELNRAEEKYQSAKETIERYKNNKEVTDGPGSGSTNSSV